MGAVGDASSFPRLLSADDPDDRFAFTFYGAFNARDFDAMAEMYVDDATFIDRRPGLTNTVVGRAAQVDQLHVMVDLGMFQAPNVVLARWDRRLILLQVPWTNRDADAPIDVDTLLLVEYDPDGRIRTVTVFDASDVHEAAVALKERQHDLERS